MNGKLLVTYASKYGATREIAEKITEILHQAGLQADVTSVKDVRDLSAYQCVILGSAVYVGKWQKEAAVAVYTHSAYAAYLHPEACTARSDAPAPPQCRPRST